MDKSKKVIKKKKAPVEIIEHEYDTVEQQDVVLKKKDKNIFRFYGRIVGKEPVKVYKGRFAGQHYFDLDVIITGRPEIKKVSVMKDRVGDEIWNDVLEDNFFGRLYVFRCTRYSGKYRLRDWKDMSINKGYFSLNKKQEKIIHDEEEVDLDDLPDEAPVEKIKATKKPPKKEVKAPIKRNWYDRSK